MKGVNRVTLMGNIGSPPELRDTPAGRQVLSFRLATSEEWVANGEKKEKTEWHTINIWGKRAEGLSRILHKGERVLIEGSIKNQQWEDKDGAKRYSYAIQATELTFCGGKRADLGSDAHVPATEGAAGTGAGDDIPF